MGWADRFPIFTQLNLITNPGNIKDTHTFFTGKYGPTGAGYTVGDLCYDWEPGSTPNPPWEKEKQNPWWKPDVDGWKDHCQNDLKIGNAGHDQGNPSTTTVEKDLTNWIRDAILAKEHITYKFKRDRALNPPWKADRERHGKGPWQITVTGPGW